MIDDELEIIKSSDFEGQGWMDGVTLAKLCNKKLKERGIKVYRNDENRDIRIWDERQRQEDTHAAYLFGIHEIATK